jgi:pimeloyl-ACP methyl ester carboxylesterase
MPFVENRGTKIYYEVYGEGHPLVLLHGFTGDLRRWKLALEKLFQVILIDLRGHGQSGKPHVAEAYSLDNRMGDVIAVLDHLGVQQTTLFGYSMGGWLAFALAGYFPERVVSLIAGGAHPFSDHFTAFAGVDGSDPNAFIQALSSFIGEEIVSALHPVIVQNDLVALSAAAQDRASLEERLSNIELPCLLFVGETDKRIEKVRRCASVLSNAQFFGIAAAGHVTAFFKADEVLPAVIGFLGKTLADKAENVGERDGI